MTTSVSFRSGLHVNDWAHAAEFAATASNLQKTNKAGQPPWQLRSGVEVDVSNMMPFRSAIFVVQPVDQRKFSQHPCAPTSVSVLFAGYHINYH